MPVASAGEQIAVQEHLLNEVDAAVILVEVSAEQAVVRYWNDGARRLYGYTAEEAIGCSLMDLITPDERRETALRHRPAVLAGVTVEDEVDVRDKHGRVFPVYARMRPLPPGDGIGPKMYVNLTVDISARSRRWSISAASPSRAAL
jgi:PAS domain S-box-containing protein